MITFSVVIPHHNIPLLLQRCLDSIPDVPDVQVIVVDDNSSTDKVDFGNFPGKDRKYTTIVFDKNGGGAGHARNIGMSRAEGKWLVFADADDYFVDDAFDILESHKDDPKDIIYFKSISVNSVTNEPSYRHYEMDKAIDEALSGTISNKKAVLAVPSPICKMIRREYIREKDILFDETYAANDMMFALKAIYWADDDAVAVSNEVLYTITTRSDGLDAMKRTSPRNFMSQLDVLIRYNRFIKNTDYDKYIIILFVIRSWKISPSTFWKALKFAVKEGALFSGTSVILKKLFKR